MSFLEYQQILVRTLQEELFPRSQEERSLFLGKLLDLKLSVRLYFIESRMIQSFIWDAVRRDEVMLDILMRCASSFSLQVHLEPKTDGLELNRALTVALGTLTTKDSTLVDSDIRSKIATQETVMRCLTNESWLVFLLFALLNYHTVVNTVRILNDAIPKASN